MKKLLICEKCRQPSWVNAVSEDGTRAGDFCMNCKEFVNLTEYTPEELRLKNIKMSKEIARMLTGGIS